MKEKYISFMKNVKSTENKDKKTCIKLLFIDSYKFLQYQNTNLEIGSFLSKDKLRTLQCEFSKLSVENFNLLTKGRLSIRVH